MNLEIPTQSYNHRRYGKPYIATLCFSSNPKGDTTFGAWVGSEGEPGLLVIQAAPGQVIMTGQKDFRGNNGRPKYGVAQCDGTVEWSETKIGAIAISRLMTVALATSAPTNPLAQFSDTQILVEFRHRGLTALSILDLPKS